MDIEFKINMNKKGINSIVFTKYYQEFPQGTKLFPQTNEEAIKIVIEELQELVKEKN